AETTLPTVNTRDRRQAEIGRARHSVRAGAATDDARRARSDAPYSELTNDDRYEAEPLCKSPPGLIQAAVIADFDGDGAADLLCARPEGLVLFKGSPQGAFDQPGRLVWTASPRMTNAMVLTCGDIARDGRLDVFLGQYKVPR